MDILSIILLAIGLAMDCFAVSVVEGQRSATPRWGYWLLMAVCFGLFQGGMPLISFFAGISFSEQIERWDHWLALVLLGLIGGKMVVESLRGKEPEELEELEKIEKPGTVGTMGAIGRLLMLSVATSIDALVTGVLFITEPDRMAIGAGTIAAVSFLFSIAGTQIGYHVRQRLRFNTELVGGLILIGIGLKIFISHIIA